MPFSRDEACTLGSANGYTMATISQPMEFRPMPLPLVPTLTVIAALLVGLGLGWAMGTRKKENQDRTRELEQRLEQALTSRADYEAEVTEHFQRTAGLLNQLSSDYRAIYQHMAKGADTLCDGTVAMQIPSASNADEETLPEHLLSTMQPLDYAPRKDGDDRGQLSEDFGIDKRSGSGSTHR